MLTIKQKLRLLSMTCAVPALMAGPALADPSVGFGLSIKFGGGTVDTGVGIRVFSDDEEDTGALSIGLDTCSKAKPGKELLGPRIWVITGLRGLISGLACRDPARILA